MDCAFGSFQKARVVTNVMSNVYEIDGFDHINNAVDKSRITNLFDNHKYVRKLPLPKALPTKKSLSIQTPVKSRKSNLKSSSLPSINVMFTNADQLTPLKLAELKKGIELEKPLIVAGCEVKPKNSKERTLSDYEIPGFSIYHVNLDLNIGRELAIYK